MEELESEQNIREGRKEGKCLEEKSRLLGLEKKLRELEKIEVG
jgi:hypothetical protein